GKNEHVSADIRTAIANLPALPRSRDLMDPSVVARWAEVVAGLRDIGAQVLDRREQLVFGASRPAAAAPSGHDLVSEILDLRARTSHVVLEVRAYSMSRELVAELASISTGLALSDDAERRLAAAESDARARRLGEQTVALIDGARGAAVRVAERGYVMAVAPS